MLARQLVRLLGYKLVNALVTFSGTGYPLSCLLYPPRAPPSGARVNSFAGIIIIPLQNQALTYTYTMVTDFVIIFGPYLGTAVDPPPFLAARSIGPNARSL